MTWVVSTWAAARSLSNSEGIADIITIRGVESRIESAGGDESEPGEQERPTTRIKTIHLIDISIV
jgi:hypothetical protein